MKIVKLFVYGLAITMGVIGGIAVLSVGSRLLVEAIFM